MKQSGKFESRAANSVERKRQAAESQRLFSDEVEDIDQASHSITTDCRFFNAGEKTDEAVLHSAAPATTLTRGMERFDIHDHHDLIAAINYYIIRPGGLDYLSRTLPLRMIVYPKLEGISQHDCCCCCSCLSNCCTKDKVEDLIDKLSFPGKSRKSIKQFSEEIHNIKSLNLGHYAPNRDDLIALEHCIDRPKSFQNILKFIKFFFSDEVPLIIDYIITRFENSESLEELDLDRCKLSPHDPWRDDLRIVWCDPLDHVEPLLSLSRLEHVIATKIVNIPSLRKIRTLDRGFAATIEDLLNEKKYSLLQGLLGSKVDNEKLCTEEVELFTFQDSIKLDRDTISIVGDYLSPKDIGIYPEICQQNPNASLYSDY